VAYKRSWRDIFVEHFEFFTKKEKRIKKERKQRPMETAAAMEIGEGGLRRLFLDDFHLLGKACAKNAPAFPQLPQARRRLTINRDRCPFSVSH
jgi:hypothetical protein